MKKKPVLFLVVSFCFYLLVSTFVGTVGTASNAYADGSEPIGPPPNSSDTTITGDGKSATEEEPVFEDISIIDIIKIIITTKI